MLSDALEKFSFRRVCMGKMDVVEAALKVHNKMCGCESTKDEKPIEYNCGTFMTKL